MNLHSQVTKRKTYHIDTYGCQMNVADSELVGAMLKNSGYIPAKDLDSANIIFVNTCAIRDHAEKKVDSQLGRYRLIKKKRPDTIIGVLGCMAQSLKQVCDRLKINGHKLI